MSDVEVIDLAFDSDDEQNNTSPPAIEDVDDAIIEPEPDQHPTTQEPSPPQQQQEQQPIVPEQQPEHQPEQQQPPPQQPRRKRNKTTTASTQPQHNLPRYPQREKRAAKSKAFFDQLISAPQHKPRYGQRQKITMEYMKQHLNNVFIGYKPGDPTVDNIPDTLPPPIHPVRPDQQVIHLAGLDQQMLDKVGVEATVEYFDSMLLNRDPGVPEGKVAVFSGQQPYNERDNDDNDDAPS